MASGYKFQDTDLDEIFEPWRTGDPKAPVTDTADLGVDFKDRYVDVSAGSPVPTDVDYTVGQSPTDLVGKDFSKIFSAIRSVPRYPTPLPWARTVPLNVSIYRQPSRPTLNVELALSFSVHRDGRVAITRTYPVYNSNPAEFAQDHVYDGSMTPLWSDAGAEPNSPYQVRVDPVSGIAPTLAHGHPLGQWFSLHSGLYSMTGNIKLTYAHGAAEGLKTGNSQVRVSVRRAEYPDSNKADAVMSANFNLLVEPSAFLFNGSTGTYVSTNNVATNYHQPEGAVNTFFSAVRVTLNTDGTYAVETATWRNGETPTYGIHTSGRWIRPEFSPTDYEASFQLTSGTFDGNDVTIPLNQFLSLGSVPRTFTVINGVPDSSAPGAYPEARTMAITLREISTKNWVGLPDNIASNNFAVRAGVVIQAPQQPAWPTTYFWQTAQWDDKDVNRVPESGGVLITSRLTLTLNANGTGVVTNSANQTLASGRWYPTGWSAGRFDVQVVAPAASSTNQMASYTNFTTGSRVYSVEVSRAHNAVSSSSGVFPDFTVNIRRAAYTSHVSSAAGKFNVRVTTRDPVPILTPPGNYDNWAGTHTVDTVVEVGPPENHIGNLTLIFSPRSYTKAVARTHPAPAECAFSARHMLRMESDGSMSLKTQYTSGLSAAPIYTDEGSFSYTVIMPAGNAADYEFRFVQVSGDAAPLSNYADWSNFGAGVVSFNGWLNFGPGVASTANTSSGVSRSYTVRLEVRHKTYPNDISSSRQLTFNTSTSLTGYSG